MSYVVRRYVAADAAAWDQFVRESRNGTFLLERGFVDYHADRFADHSLLVLDDAGRMAGALPANEAGGALHSHAGLTYGGLVIGSRPGAADVLAMLQAIRAYLAEAGLASLTYKTIPWIYHRQPAEDDRYALFRLDAHLVRRDVLCVLGRDDRPRYQERRKRGAKSARKAGVVTEESRELDAYWAILDETLRERHGVAPVHSLQEITTLRARFPEQLRLFTAIHAGEVVAGALVFETPRVAHVQYIAASPAGRAVGALDAVFDTLLGDTYAGKPYFDFGISNEDQGRTLNLGLLEQKEGFGGRAVVHDHYRLEAAA